MNIPPCFLIPLLALAPLAAGAGEQWSLKPAAPFTLKDAAPYLFNDGELMLVVQGSSPSWCLHACARKGENSYAVQGVYRVDTRVLEPDFAATRFDETGLTIVLRRRAENGRSELEVTHRFDYSKPEDSFRFMADEKDVGPFLSDLEGRPCGFMWSAPLAEKHRAAGQEVPARSELSKAEPLPQLAEGQSDNCQAVTVTMPDGSERVSVYSLSDGMEQARNSEARPCALPDNRITRALRRAFSRTELKENGRLLPNYFCADDYAELLMHKGDLVPADRLLELCYRFRFWHSFNDWVCDAQGENIVFLRDSSSGLVTFEMVAYRWDEAKQAFVHRGTYDYCSRTLFLDPAGIAFDDKGMRLHLTDKSKDGATELRYSCRFDYENGPDTAYFVATGREQGDAYSDALAGDSEAPCVDVQESGFGLRQPDGRFHLVGLGGALKEELLRLLAGHPGAKAVLGEAVRRPENRVTQQLPPQWAEAVSQADEDGELLSWFCDEAGEHFVIVTQPDDFSDYGLQHYRWDAAQQAFVERGRYVCEPGGDRILNPMQVQFLEEGMNVSFLRVSKDGALESQWSFCPYEQP